MHRVEPKVFMIGESAIHGCVIADYLDYIGCTRRSTTSSSEAEDLIEFMGRLCYRSFEPGLNPNVTKIREDQAAYINNILASGHGSVLEHAVSHWVFTDVSRVFTHELVRHRVGTAFSQESLRYVRLVDLGLWLPPEVEAKPEVAALFEQTFKSLEDLQIKLTEAYGLDRPQTCPQCLGVESTTRDRADRKSVCGKCGGTGQITTPFDTKKRVTSAMRRVAPIGLATCIGVTFNMRALRHVIEMRTAEGAEAEIRYVFDIVAKTAKENWPLIFRDFTRNEKGAWIPKYRKV